jgi:hypothetical protein
LTFFSDLRSSPYFAENSLRRTRILQCGPRADCPHRLPEFTAGGGRTWSEETARLTVLEGWRAAARSRTAPSAAGGVARPWRPLCPPVAGDGLVWQAGGGAAVLREAQGRVPDGEVETWHSRRLFTATAVQAAVAEPCLARTGAAAERKKERCPRVSGFDDGRQGGSTGGTCQGGDQVAPCMPWPCARVLLRCGAWPGLVLAQCTEKQREGGTTVAAWSIAETPRPSVHRNRVWSPRGRDAADARTRAPALQLYVVVHFYFVVPLSKLRNSKNCQQTCPKTKVVEEL